MEISNLIPHIEALIFASDKPLSSTEITELINQAFGFMEDKIVAEQVDAALEGIVEKYNSEFYPFEVKESVMTRWFVAAAIAAVMIAGTTFSAAVPQPQSSTQPATAQVVNLNTAAAADLQKLPGIGAAMAARIIEYRQKNGGFKKVEELMNVQGIGEKVFLKLKPLVSVTPPKTTER